ncbi:MAG: DNA-directed RNA polymerase subunit beta [Elusimicrobia bacterium CG08_land_8_20_14_0_20_44_26]|nr:MAG: DNA-directed RNA polymerase subunit beta [Elusimicrobia bacterium CG08_land_8_20_14_0_20_44_26]
MREVRLERVPGKEFFSSVHFLDIQTKSYEDFLQKDVKPEERKNTGLEGAFRDIFPITSANGRMELEYVSYSAGAPNTTEENARKKEITYSVPVKAKVRLKKYGDSGSAPHIFDKEINFFNVPYMTESGSFIINGNDRVVVSQLHRSPGVIFEEGEKNEITNRGFQKYNARIIPYRGAWVEFEFDYENVLYVVIDRRKRFPVTVMLRALGLETNEQIINVFYETEEVPLDSINLESPEKSYLAVSLKDADGKEKHSAGSEVTREVLAGARESGLKILKIITKESFARNVAIIETLKKDNIQTQKQAVLEFFKKLRIQEFTSEATAKEFFETLLFKTTKRYDLSFVGRYKINARLEKIFERMKLEVPSLSRRTLCYADILATIYNIIALNHKMETKVDDIDHLGNRRVRSVGELLQNQIKIGLSNMSRVTREKMNMKQDIKNPQELINTTSVITAINKFFAMSQLSQFLDETSPISELTHKRRLSAIGPGGLNRKRAGFEVRDVHNSHYGKICPIETPEGQNIGLIVSPSVYSKVNQYGLLETPYRKVEDGTLSSKIEYMTAYEEEKYTIGPATVKTDESGKITEDTVMVRRGGEFFFTEPKKLEYIDVSSNQILGPSAGLIPFIEHDDANRALMGANMQRQAVPLLSTEAPIVATGLERKIARDSHALLTAKNDGEVVSVQSDRIIIRRDDGEYDIYNLKKFARTNQNTCQNFSPMVQSGQNVRKGSPITKGCATSDGLLALGKNVLVAFLSWEGYNYEDAIIISERLVKEDVFTSIHITRHEIEVHSGSAAEREEEITRDIPGASPNQIANLDSSGIVAEGTYVTPGNVLVGKVVPEEESYVPHAILLRSIFGDKGRRFKDVSLMVPPGVRGTVIGVEVLERKSKLSKAEILKKIKDISDRFKDLSTELRGMKARELKDSDKKLAEKKISENAQKKEMQKINDFYDFELKLLKEKKDSALSDAKGSIQLPPGVYKKVKVYIATRRKIAIGDKMAGRHGNKGVVSIILPVEDMPYLSDGTPIDMMLSPLSVPSRMNIGQILETILGFAGVKQNVRFICPSFNSPEYDKGISENLKKFHLPDEASFQLFDGRTGSPFMEKVTIGYPYILKLVHMAEDKIHARSTGHYSMVTRQPVGGKSLMGGQRFGEMEVWAIEGYGAAYLLREFLTIKSDDVKSRQKFLETIIGDDREKEAKEKEKDRPFIAPQPPESFQVLMRELQSMGFKVELLKKGRKK